MSRESGIKAPAETSLAELWRDHSERLMREGVALKKELNEAHQMISNMELNIDGERLIAEQMLIERDEALLEVAKLSAVLAQCTFDSAPEGEVVDILGVEHNVSSILPTVEEYILAATSKSKLIKQAGRWKIDGEPVDTKWRETLEREVLILRGGDSYTITSDGRKRLRAIRATG